MLRSYEYGSNRAYEFIYDMRGRLAAKKCTDGSRIIFGYDSKDYLKSSSVMLPGQKLGTAYHYGSGSSNQPYKSRVYGVTITDATAVKMLINTSSASDRLDRLASRSINAVGGKSLVYGYTYGRGTTLPLTLSATVGEVSSTLVYTYDAAGNITSVTDGENVTRYCYDNMGQLIREDNPYSQKTCVYAYDSCGNILSRTEYGYTDDENPAGGTAAVYEYNNADWGDQLTAWNGESITYDAIGNPLLYRGRSLTWTQGRRLAGVSSEGLAAYYTYDESGTRTGKTVNGVSTQYYINGSQILAQKSGEDILYFLYDETGAAVGFKYNNNLYIYRKNLQGDILAVLNGQTGAVEASYTYDAWGKVISSTGALAEINPFRYRGYYYDSETGLYYLQSRYYDSETGRFINADDADYIGADGSLLSYNLFAYCKNNPVNRFDAEGNLSLPNWLKIAVGAVALAGAVALTVATGGGAAAVAVGVAKIVGSVIVSTAAGAGIGYVKNGKQGAIDGACNGFMMGSLSACGGAALKYAKVHAATTGSSNAMGKAGERMAGIDPKAKKSIEINGRTRIPDALTDVKLTEVKNVKYISNTQQLRDFADYAHVKDLKMELFVRPNTRVAKSILEAGWDIKYLW